MRFEIKCEKGNRPIDKIKIPLIGSDLFSTRDNRFYPLYIWCHPVINNLPNEIIYSYPINTSSSSITLTSRRWDPVTTTKMFYGSQVNSRFGSLTAIINPIHANENEMKYSVFFSRYIVYSIDVNGNFEVILAIAANTISDLLTFSKTHPLKIPKLSSNLFVIYNEEHMKNFSASFKRKISTLRLELLRENNFNVINGDHKLMFGNPLTLEPELKHIDDIESIRKSAIKLMISDIVNDYKKTLYL